MATINGTLKYKQDDGSIVELSPVGVDARARTLATAAGQTANNAKTAADTGLQYIGDWPFTDPTDTITTEVKTLNTRVAKLEQAANNEIQLPIVGTVRSTMQTASGDYNVILALFPTVEYEKAIIKGIDGILDTGIRKANTVKIVRPTGEKTDIIEITPGFEFDRPEVTVILGSLPSDITNGAVVSISGAYLYIMFQYT